MHALINQQEQFESAQRLAAAFPLFAFRRTSRGLVHKVGFHSQLFPRFECGTTSPQSICEVEIEFCVATLFPEFDWHISSLTVLYIGPHTFDSNNTNARRYHKYRVNRGCIDLIDVVSAHKKGQFDIIVVSGPQADDVTSEDIEKMSKQVLSTSETEFEPPVNVFETFGEALRY